MRGRTPWPPRKRQNGEGLKRDDRRDVDDRPTVRSHHPRQHGARKSHDGFHVQPDGAQLLVEWGSLEVPAGRVARIVNKNLDRKFREASHNLIEPLGGREIRAERLDVSPLLFHFACQSFQPVPPPRDTEHAVSAPRELPRKRSAYAGRSPGDDSPALHFGASTHIALLV